MANDNLHLTLGDLSMDVGPRKATVPEGDLPVELISSYMADPAPIKQVVIGIESLRNNTAVASGFERARKRVVSLAVTDPHLALDEIRKIKAEAPGGMPRIYDAVEGANIHKIVLTDGKVGFRLSVDKSASAFSANYYIDPEDVLFGQTASLDAISKDAAGALDFLKMTRTSLSRTGDANALLLLYRFLSDRPKTEVFMAELAKVLHTARLATVTTIVEAFCQTGTHSALQAYRKRAKSRLRLNDAIQDMVDRLRSSGSIDMKAGYLTYPDFGYYYDYFTLVTNDGKVYTSTLSPRETYTGLVSGELDRKLASLQKPGSYSYEYSRCEDKEMLKKVAAALGKRHPETVLIMDEGKRR